MWRLHWSAFSSQRDCVWQLTRFGGRKWRSGLNRISHPDWVKLSVELNCAPNQNTKFFLSLHKYTGKHIITVERETTSLTAVITSDTWVEAKKDERPYKEENNTLRRIRRRETESDISSEDKEFSRKMTDKIRINKIKTRKQKYYNIIEVRIKDIDTYSELDCSSSAKIMDE